MLLVVATFIFYKEYFYSS
ncbi:TPA: DUF1270 family protein [Staphylococcus aureus]|nr:DUF1270 family protein [Staphylococcus aureus]HEA3933668.1 DUF1270 family protein [Staphylococcus aureus]